MSKPEKKHNDIYALQRIEVLDEKTCNFCISMDSRVIELDDPMGEENLFHGHCRGIWAEIGKEELDKPDITGIPKGLRKRFKGVFDLEQPDKPLYIKPNSDAEDFLKS